MRRTNRVISTANVNQVPYPWVEQTRPGGRVLTPWGTPYYNGGLLRLAVGGGGTAQGGLVAKTPFIGLRDQRIPRVRSAAASTTEDAITTSTNLHPHDVAGHYDVQIGIGIQVPQCIYLYQAAADDSEDATLWFFDRWSGSWASLHHNPQVVSRSYRVRQLGPRHLWDEVEAAYRGWRDAGSPDAEQWTFTVTPQQQRISLELQHRKPTDPVIG